MIDIIWWSYLGSLIINGPLHDIFGRFSPGFLTGKGLFLHALWIDYFHPKWGMFRWFPLPSFALIMIAITVIIIIIPSLCKLLITIIINTIIINTIIITIIIIIINTIIDHCYCHFCICYYILLNHLCPWWINLWSYILASGYLA